MATGKVFPQAFKRPGRVAVHTSASSPEFKNEWSSSSASPLSFNCVFTENWLCEWSHRVQSVWCSLCQRCVLWFTRWKSCDVPFPVPLRPVWSTKPRPWDILLTRSILYSWLYVCRVIFILPFQFDRFYEVYFRCNVLNFPACSLCDLIY